MSGRVVLSLDWDFVTGNCQDDSGEVLHCGYCRDYRDGYIPERPSTESYTQPRINANFRRLASLEFRQTSAPVYVAECHASIASLLRNNDWVFDYDAHVDAYSTNPLQCGSWRRWVLQQHALVNCVNEYHPQNERGKPMEPPPADIAFICKSSPWTHPRFDYLFNRLIYRVSNNAGSDPIFIGHMKKSLQREWKEYNAHHQ